MYDMHIDLIDSIWLLMFFISNMELSNIRMLTINKLLSTYDY